MVEVCKGIAETTTCKTSDAEPEAKRVEVEPPNWQMMLDPSTPPLPPQLVNAGGVGPSNSMSSDENMCNDITYSHSKVLHHARQV